MLHFSNRIHLVLQIHACPDTVSEYTYEYDMLHFTFSNIIHLVLQVNACPDTVTEYTCDMLHFSDIIHLVLHLHLTKLHLQYRSMHSLTVTEQ